ncbi:Rho GTPase-activating protein 24 [Camelus dromedarius]|uniref:Rho GTPase-activating protein 24 n=1 Tax=Camelus dromedarius TaxID=9838 RepID=A0A5N4EG66_CAMDR|nr:Rho GTPase-activating protein 24 [Camelus dromedarius]
MAKCDKGCERHENSWKGNIQIRGGSGSSEAFVQELKDEWKLTMKSRHTQDGKLFPAVSGDGHGDALWIKGSFKMFCRDEALLIRTLFQGKSISLIMEENNDSTESLQQGQGRSSATKCGWLRKQGGFVKTWHTRWFVLKGDQLYYFKDEDETKPLVSRR